MRKIPTKHQFVAIYKHEDEYIVKVPSNPAADYYTGDWSDALDTANHMEKSYEESRSSARIFA